MIHAVFILDASGTPIYVWKSETAPPQIFKGKDENLIASFVSALLNFGQETFVAPQRIDFMTFALSFFTFKIGERVFWVAAISDVTDHQRATNIVLKDLAKKLSNLIIEAQLEEGLIVVSEEISKKIENVIQDTIKSHTRLFPQLRSTIPFSTIFSLVLGTPTVLASYYLLMFFFTALPSEALNPYLSAFALVVSFGIITGIICGSLAANNIAGFISSYIASLVVSALTYPELNLIVIIVLALTISLLSGLIGFVTGYWRDASTLTLQRTSRKPILGKTTIEFEEEAFKELEEL
ncbi:MAG: hypothetical protein ACTSX9_00710 [Candidatus Njordarchaeales archaeon]